MPTVSLCKGRRYIVSLDFCFISLVCKVRLEVFLSLELGGLDARVIKTVLCLTVSVQLQILLQSLKNRAVPFDMRDVHFVMSAALPFVNCISHKVKNFLSHAVVWCD